MDRMICKKDLVLFLFPHRTLFWRFVRIASVRPLNKFPKLKLLEVFMQYFCIISHYLSLLEQRFCDFQIVIITNSVIISSVCIKRVDCSDIFPFLNKNICCGHYRISSIRRFK